MTKLPRWFKQEIPQASTLDFLSRLRREHITTVCVSAHCPNIAHCFQEARLTFMILGPLCTRNCRFCCVPKTSDYSQLSLDSDEPYRVVETVKRLGLRYVVITSVTRDDLEDGGAGHFARTIELIHALKQDIKIEVLLPDFYGRSSSIRCVLDAGVCVAAHNIETVTRLYDQVRPLADYTRSLEVLSTIKNYKPDTLTKSALLLGMGETEDEVIRALQDLKDCSCDIVVLGQYLAPSSLAHPVKEFITPDQFERYRLIGIKIGFKHVLSGPLVRSSYQAEEVYQDVACV